MDVLMNRCIRLESGLVSSVGKLQRELARLTEPVGRVFK
jgi:hypothetical protein